MKKIELFVPDATCAAAITIIYNDKRENYAMKICTVTLSSDGVMESIRDGVCVPKEVIDDDL